VRSVDLSLHLNGQILYYISIDNRNVIDWYFKITYFKDSRSLQSEDQQEIIFIGYGAPRGSTLAADHLYDFDVLS
jgi:hypothetical protein